MVVTTTLKRGYAWRIIIIAVVSGVLGLWGVYDYMVAIPRKAEAHKRSQIYAMVKDALGAQPSAEARAVTVEAHQAVDDELKLIFEGELGRAIEGETLSKDDVAHYQKIVVALNETISIMKEIDEVIEAHGGWPAAFQTTELTEGAVAS